MKSFGYMACGPSERSKERPEIIMLRPLVHCIGGYSGSIGICMLGLRGQYCWLVRSLKYFRCTHPTEFNRV